VVFIKNDDDDNNNNNNEYSLFQKCTNTRYTINKRTGVLKAIHKIPIEKRNTSYLTGLYYGPNYESDKHY